jgi:hypothetical protein
MTNYEKIKNMNVGEMAEFLANKAFIIWKSEQSKVEALRGLNATQIKAAKRYYYNNIYRLLQEEVEE